MVITKRQVGHACRFITEEKGREQYGIIIDYKNGVKVFHVGNKVIYSLNDDQIIKVGKRITPSYFSCSN